MNSLLIESNRVIAQSSLNPLTADDESKTDYTASQKQDKSSWTTSIDTGIELKPGDQISVEAAMMNIDGSTQGFQQFNGKVNKPEVNTNIFRKDNEMTVSIAFYTTNLIQNNCPLPMGRHMVEINDTLQGPYGSPCFNGRHLWRSRMRDVRGNAFETDYTLGPAGWTGAFYCERGLNNGPLAIKKNAGSFFFLGINYNVPIQNVETSAGPPPVYGAAPRPQFCINCASAAAFIGWTAQVPFFGLPGVQFGSNSSTLLPQTDAYGWGTNEVLSHNNLNRNVNIRDTYPNSGHFSGQYGRNGGAAPWVIVNDKVNITPTVEAYGGTSSKSLPYDWNEFVVGPHSYSYECQRDSTFYKGSQYNYRPNGNRHFQPRIDHKEYMCKGPFYSTDFNKLIIENDPRYPGSTVGQMQGMCDFHIYNRTTDYWNLQVSEFDIKINTGNITPTRISQIITELMKKRKGNADDPEDIFVKQQTYQPASETQKNNTKDDLVVLKQPNLSSQCYGLFPTVLGACLQSQRDEPADSIFGWSCLTSENLKQEDIDDPTSQLMPGLDFNPLQAELKYWSLMMAGDYLSWKWSTYLNPLISYRPFTSGDEDAYFDYRYWSVYTGKDDIVNVNGLNFHNRARPDGGVATVKIGELGQYSCLQDTPREGVSQKTTLACAGIWQQINGTKDHTVTPNTYRIAFEPYALWADPASPFDPEEYRTLKPDKYDIFPTNIVWDGQVTMEDWNNAYNDLEGHNIVASGNDTLASQSNEFFDNTFVEWTLGRLDDQETHNELYIADDFGFRQKNVGHQGYAQYLPNIYQTNRLFQNTPFDAGEPEAWTNIDDILSRASCSTITPGIQGTYTFMSRKIGKYNEDGLGYTPDSNPWSYANATGSVYAPRAELFGYPCWSSFKSEYELDVEKKNGYQKVAKRTIKAFRYLPQGGLPNGFEYTAENAYSQNLVQPYGKYQGWSTKPATLTFAQYEEIWNAMKKLNNGKGLGLIPIFSTDPSDSVKHKNVPFIGVIYMDHEDKGMPLPEKGEWFGLSSPSLSQHDLSLPASTQKTIPNIRDNVIQQEYTSGWIGQTQYLTNDKPTADDKELAIKSSYPSSFATTYYAGCNDPLWSFNNTLNRYAYSQFHTPLYTGNGDAYQYGNTGQNVTPEEKEVRVLATTANFSRCIKPAYCMQGELKADSGVYKRPHNAEICDGNIIMDWTGPGGFQQSPTHPSSQWSENGVYLSPVSCTHWEMRYLPVAGVQKNYDGGSVVKPPTLHKNDPKNITAPSIMPYAYITTNPDEKYPTVSSQCGVGIVDLYVPRIGSTPIKLSNTSFDMFEGTLFHKMGFDLGNFLPTFYQVQTIFDHTLFSQYMSPDSPAGLQYSNCLYPVCTQAIISSSFVPALTTGLGYEVKEPVPSAIPNQIYPWYKTGMILRTAATNADSESMFAARLPQKLAFPYLVCRSNIATPCGLQYIGGPDGKQISPTVALLATNYSTDDFFFTTRSDLIFTVTRPYVLTEIKTSIHLPNGDSADSILDENSAVIYRIDFAKRELTDEQILKERKDEDKALGVQEDY